MMCDWPVWTGYYRYEPPRLCGNGDVHRLGNLDVCSKHFEMAMGSLLSEAREHAGGVGADSHLEIQLRLTIRDIERARRVPRSESEVPETRTSFVYFVFREGFVKIGTTRDLRQRLKALAAGGSMPDGMSVGPVTLLAAIPGTRENEQFFHRKFAHLRVDPRREWFLFSEELRTFISGLKGADLAALEIAA